MEARRAGTCSLCCAPIALGAMVLPVDVEGAEGTRTHWLHQHCVSEQDRAVCKHWRRTGECLYENSCVFAHPERCIDTVEATIRAILNAVNQIIASRTSTSNT